MVVTAGTPGGVRAWFSRPRGARPDFVGALQTAGFSSVRTLADRDGLVFVEGIKRRPARSPAA